MFELNFVNDYLFFVSFKILFSEQNTRRDGQLIARINELEKKLLVSTKECDVLSENLKTTEKKVSKIYTFG